MKKNAFVFFIFVLCFSSCKSKTTFSIVSYNAQTFFDLIENGREFKEFKKSKWREEDYHMRLERLLNAVKICTNQLEKKTRCARCFSFARNRK